jgi:hypothetical protein
MRFASSLKNAGFVLVVLCAIASLAKAFKISTPAVDASIKYLLFGAVVCTVLGWLVGRNASK